MQVTQKNLVLGALLLVVERGVESTLTSGGLAFKFQCTIYIKLE